MVLLQSRSHPMMPFRLSRSARLAQSGRSRYLQSADVHANESSPPAANQQDMAFAKDAELSAIPRVELREE
jgi:hypothetical protein